MTGETKILSAFDFLKNQDWPRSFLDFDITRFERMLRAKPEGFWQEQGQRRALHIFHAAAKRVPAYKDFLRKHGLRPESIKTIEDFKRVPPTDKKNYIAAYPLRNRLWDGEFTAAKLIAVSSGTSGEPNFWPRGGFQEFEAGIIHELIYRYLFEINRYSTLAIIGFPMGIYVSGIATLLPSFAVSSKGYRLAVVGAGNSKTDMLKAAKNLAENCEQVILVGHPFFIKDVIETARDIGLNLKKKRLRMMFCSEGFDETWRKYVSELTGKSILPGDIISTYGSSEMLLMAHETPLSVLARISASQNPLLKKRIFGDIVPNFFQYNPFLRYIESVGDELVFTAASGVPLVRFNLHDSGRIISFNEITLALRKEKIKWPGALKTGRKPLWRLPFVTLGGRSDYTMVFYAANIYPEHVKTALGARPFLEKLTGKFVMEKRYLKNMDEALEINIELRNGVKAEVGLADIAGEKIVRTLKTINAEYNDAASRLGKNMRPKVKLWPYQHPKYFRPGLKPRLIFSKLV